jgi:hypothetical protein
MTNEANTATLSTVMEKLAEGQAKHDQILEKLAEGQAKHDQILEKLAERQFQQEDTLENLAEKQLKQDLKNEEIDSKFTRAAQLLMQSALNHAQANERFDRIEANLEALNR